MFKLAIIRLCCFFFNECRCFLRTDNYFIWAFIAPVIIIFVCNFILLTMAAVIMWKQQKKRKINAESNQALKWLKAVVSLTVVMGLTWIIGVLVVERKELLPLTYINTIIVAFQGFFMFLVLVVFTKSVRDDISKVTVSKWQKIRTKKSGVRN